MHKNFITLFLILLISFIFTTNSFAIILENLPTKSNSAQPIPTSIISNMSKDFDISTYNYNRNFQNLSEATSVSNSPISDSKINTNKNNSSNDKSANNNFWYWLITPILIITFIIFWIFRKQKN